MIRTLISPSGRVLYYFSDALDPIHLDSWEEYIALSGVLLEGDYQKLVDRIGAI